MQLSNHNLQLATSRVNIVSYAVALRSPPPRPLGEALYLVLGGSAYVRRMETGQTCRDAKGDVKAAPTDDRLDLPIAVVYV